MRPTCDPDILNDSWKQTSRNEKLETGDHKEFVVKVQADCRCYLIQFIEKTKTQKKGLPWQSGGQDSPFQCRRCGFKPQFDSWLGSHVPCGQKRKQNHKIEAILQQKSIKPFFKIWVKKKKNSEKCLRFTLPKRIQSNNGNVLYLPCSIQKRLDTYGQ